MKTPCNGHSGCDGCDKPALTFLVPAARVEPPTPAPHLPQLSRIPSAGVKGSVAASSDGMMALLPMGSLITPGTCGCHHRDHNDLRRRHAADLLRQSRKRSPHRRRRGAMLPAQARNSMLRRRGAAGTGHPVHPAQRSPPSRSPAEAAGTARVGRSRRSRHGCGTVRPTSSPSPAPESSLTGRW